MELNTIFASIAVRPREADSQTIIQNCIARPKDYALKRARRHQARAERASCIKRIGP
jgi:hypothetical protein